MNNGTGQDFFEVWLANNSQSCNRMPPS